jgi:pimeloyl-ACP methyl ester carboxylesterase/thiol-disulfide isomerase/thioredoxin
MATEQIQLAHRDASADAYNYESFDYGLDAPELERWRREGPSIGEPAPDFELVDLDGTLLTLSDLRGRPVVLEFGSYTCPIFSDRVPAMEQLAREHPQATFLVIYVREAHPGEIQGAHRSLAEKRLAAHKLTLEEALSRRVLVDSVEGATHRAYGGAWNPVYVIDANGRVAMRQAWNHPSDVAATLSALESGVQPGIPESSEMLREPGGRPMGQRLVERGGLKALRDLYQTAPAAVQEALRNSPSTEVREGIARFTSGAAELVTITSKDGTPIALWKTGSGPSLLVVHGTCADHSAWEKVVPLLAHRFTIYAMDRRGRGASGDAAEYALEREMEDVVAAVEALPGPVYVYGHSFGGVCAVGAASRARNLARLVLYEGGPIRIPRGMVLVPQELILRLEELTLAGEREQAVMTFMLEAGAITPDELDVLRTNASWPARVAAAHTIPRELRALNDYVPDLDRAGTLEMPVLMIVGEQTDPFRRGVWEQFASQLKDARVRVLPGQRHAAHQTAPALLATALSDFLLAS